MEKIIVNPVEVRGLGDIVSLKSSSDFLGSGTSISSSTDSLYGTVFSGDGLSVSVLTVSVDRLVLPSVSSFSVDAVLTVSDIGVSGAVVYCKVNDTVLSGTTDSNGEVSFTVSCDGSSKYDITVFYRGSGSVGGSFVNTSVIVSELPSVLSLNAEKPIIQTGDNDLVYAKLTTSDGTPVPFYPVQFYEEYTPAIRFNVENDIIQSGDGIDLSSTLVDADDGSRVRQSGIPVQFFEEVSEITMFDGTETFSRVGTGTGTLNIRYTDDNELVYTAASGILFHSDLMFQSDNDWECTFQLKASGRDGGRVGLYSVSSESGEMDCVAFKTQSSKIYVGIGTSDNFDEQNSGINYSWYVTIKIESTETRFSVYINDNLVHSLPVEWGNDLLCFGLHGWTTGNVVYVKDLCFKELE